jgi:CDP-glucose 4,6-dehydratase
MEINYKFWKNKVVLITGHTGFKGSWLCIYLHFLGAKIIGYALKPNKNQTLFKILKISKFIHKNYFGNIQNKSNLEKIIKKDKPKIIFHLAAQSLVINSCLNPLDNFKTNLMGSVNLLEIIRKLPYAISVVFVTSDKCYKINKIKKKYKETDELGGTDPYSSSKACAEILVNSYKKTFFYNSEINIATVRSGNIIGGGDWNQNRLIPDIFRSIINKKKLLIRNINHTRPWLFILDALTGYLKVAEKIFKNKKYSEAWNFAPNYNKSVKEIVKYALKKKFIKNYKIQKKSHNIETLKLDLNNNKSKKILKWKNKLNFFKTLDYTFDWYNNLLNEKDMHLETIKQIQKFIKYEM